ncbi:hypothetical protein GUJ93_ZPchr0001g30470 [Zizania palustris]|uniref:Uncharacterized protein n=1 Tax=Zizania palustris TaxID=103762 RepID=A0A8J5VAU0_ZIZPA|nr:hypothetical protein GUJ93_ZPchr0001g30470 [Zizania palustris]
MVVKKQGGGYCGAGLAVRRREWPPAPLPLPDLATRSGGMLSSYRRLLPSRHRIWPHGLSHYWNWPPSPFLLPVLGRLGTAVNA